MSGFEGWLRKAAWDRDGSRVAVGGADRCVTIYNVEQHRMTHKLPGEAQLSDRESLFHAEIAAVFAGHTGFTTAVVFSPTDNIVASAGTDSTIFLGELPER
jgi:Prp8 binding protein